MKIIYSLIPVFFTLFLKAQGGLIIGSGTNVIVINSPHIVIEDGKFKNDGVFTAGSSTVYIKGSAATPNSTIGGTSVTTFNDLNIKKNSNNTRLDFDIKVDGNLYMGGGLLDLNNSDLELGGDIIGETGSNRITGTNGGAVIKTVELDMPFAANPGNIGVEITSAVDLGMTTIQRSHVQMANGSNESIYRHYDISPTNNSELDATLRINYFDEELAGLTENDLEVWHFDGANWTTQNLNSRNVSDNWVECSGIAFFHTHTLAEDMSSPLPIELISFDARLNDKKEVDIFWTTTTEINNDYFSVERSKDGVFFTQIAQVNGVGNSTSTHHYKALDDNPFIGINYYRLKQVDYDGTKTYSAIRSVIITSDQHFTAYPNPMNAVLHITGEGISNSGNVAIEIYDALGKMVYYNSQELDDQAHSIDIHEVAEFISGNYFLVIQTPLEKYAFNLVKVGE